MPVAYLKQDFVNSNQVSQHKLVYLHTDQLNTPRVGTSAAANITWRWNSDVFGVGDVEDIGDGSGVAATINLRMPGQYFDRESGSFYNYFRDYDSSTGRYLQSDPVGLRGGPNTYAYVSNNPIFWFDRFGLTKLTFDVSKGILTIDPQRDGASPYEVDATSGRGQCENKPECEKTPNQGPIPRGEYYLDSTQLDNPSFLDDLKREFFTPHAEGGGDWGDWRDRIYPYPGTQRFGRSGFYLHGGYRDGSAGCIDFGGGPFGNDRLLNDLLGDPDNIIPLTVK
jgi:RHS repeat-associated protein